MYLKYVSIHLTEQNTVDEKYILNKVCITSLTFI